MATSTNVLSTARAEVLFVSDMSASARAGRSEVDAAIRAAVRARGGVRPCAAEMAAAYGDRPETAAARMSWARDVVRAVYHR
ncbi:MAG TPA: hypothetical protein VES42_20055 [Pilimelia sp.]|nr:hypothetical protein [Pilimelia sp.]